MPNHGNTPLRKLSLPQTLREHKTLQWVDYILQSMLKPRAGLHARENVQLNGQLANQIHTFMTCIKGVYWLQRAKHSIHCKVAGNRQYLIQKADLDRSNKAEKSVITQSVWTVSSEHHTAEGQQQQGQRTPPPGSNSNKGAFSTKSKTLKGSIWKVQLNSSRDFILQHD